MKKRILQIRKQSRIEIPKENLWFFSDDSVIKQSPVNRRKKVRDDRLSILKEEHDRYSLNYYERKADKEECTFVVDWQLSDTF